MKTALAFVFLLFANVASSSDLHCVMVLRSEHETASLSLLVHAGKCSMLFVDSSTSFRGQLDKIDAVTLASDIMHFTSEMKKQSDNISKRNLPEALLIVCVAIDGKMTADQFVMSTTDLNFAIMRTSGVLSPDQSKATVLTRVLDALPEQAFRRMRYLLKEEPIRGSGGLHFIPVEEFKKNQSKVTEIGKNSKMPENSDKNQE